MAKIYKIYSQILSLLLILLGFSACDDDNNDDDQGPILMYGTPSATYKVKGVIVSEDTSLPVKNIRTILVETYDGKENPYWGDTIYTNNEGKFDLMISSNRIKSANFNLKIEDIDGDENGNFNTKTQALTIVNSKNKNEVEEDLGQIEIAPKKD